MVNFVPFRLIQLGEEAKEKLENGSGSLTNLLQAVEKEMAKTGEHIHFLSSNG